jgi:hypothetical protein
MFPVDALRLAQTPQYQIAMYQKKIPEERLVEIKKRLDMLPPRSGERKSIVKAFGELYGVSINSVYRALRERGKPKGLRRSDHGKTRILPDSEMEWYCQIIAAMKIRTLNKKNHHLSTSEAIRLLENPGIITPAGLVQAPWAILKKTTVNRYLSAWGYDLRSLDVEPAAVRFQAKHSNECWQFDLSPSDLKDLGSWPDWMEARKSRPQLMLYSVVDDRSGTAYQEYHAVYGEDVEAALRFLFQAMSPKEAEGFPFHGIPQMIYMDNGPIAKSRVFQRVMDLLGIEVRMHMPHEKDGRRSTARSKGKVERPFRTVKEVHETLYHFHKPQDEAEANRWLLNFILRYNEKEHRTEKHSRMEDWIENLPPSGIRKMCSWERFCVFAREPERRKVGGDPRIPVDGGIYQVSPELAGQEVILWWGLFDSELFVEAGEKRFGPYYSAGGPIPLYRFRRYKKTQAEKRADAIEKLARELDLPKEALEMDSRTKEALRRVLPEDAPFVEFRDPDPFQEYHYPSLIEAKKAIAQYLGLPLAKLDPAQLAKINEILSTTLKKKEVIEAVKSLFCSSNKGGPRAQ